MRQNEGTKFFQFRPSLRTLLGVAVFVCLAVPAARAGSLTKKKAAARAQFERAENLRAALQGQPQSERTLEDYQSVVKAYRRVYQITPLATVVTPALLAVAELYQEMGRQFDPKYFQSAIDAYQFLLHQYPSSRYRTDALLTIGQIQKEDLDDLDEAEKTFQEFLKRYPHSPQAEQARQALAGIKKIRVQESQPKAREQVAKEVEQDRRLPRVVSVRHWNAENYSRIVIDLEGLVKYQSSRIPNPDRIYFDLYKARLSPTLSGKTLEVGDGFLKAIRVAQNQAGVVRVVLDVNKVRDYSAFLLPNPYRLVIDIRGRGPTLTRASTRVPSADDSPEVKAQAEAQPEEVAPVAPQPAAATRSTLTARARTEPSTPPPVPPPTRNGERSLTRALGLKISRLVIDPGHGGHDTGTIGSGGLMEKNLCLDIALRLGKLIQARLPGAEVIYTRKDDTFVPLEERTAIANQAKADLFISIHANSSHNHKTRGIETYYLNFSTSPESLEVAARENALSQSSVHELQDLIKKIAKNEKVEESRELASDLQDALVEQLERNRAGMKSRGVKQAPFVVLIGANMPSVLSEISFLSNPTDAKLLKKPVQRERIAEGLFEGIEKYLASLNSLSYNILRPTSAGR